MLGHTGVGKTSTVVELAKYSKRKKIYSKIVGFDPHDILTRERLLDYYISPSDDFWAERLMKIENGKYKFANSLLILDDYRSLLKSDRMPPGFLDLLMLRRKIAIDIVYIIHSPKLILERLSYYTNYYSIFYTESSASDFSDRIPNFAACQKAANLVNKYVKEYGRGVYPNFPHVIVRTESEELELMHMTQSNVSKLYA